VKLLCLAGLGKQSSSLGVGLVASVNQIELNCQPDVEAGSKARQDKPETSLSSLAFALERNPFVLLI